MFKFLVDKLVLNDKYTAKGSYMEPEIEFKEDIKRGPLTGGYCHYNAFSCDIVIKDKYINDIGIQNHELAHARQYGRLFWIHSGLTLISGWWVLLIELEAYRNQVKQYSYKTKKEYTWIVDALDVKYDTGIAKTEIQYWADYVFRDLIK